MSGTFTLLCDDIVVVVVKKLNFCVQVVVDAMSVTIEDAIRLYFGVLPSNWKELKERDASELKAEVNRVVDAKSETYVRDSVENQLASKFMSSLHMLVEHGVCLALEGSDFFTTNQTEKRFIVQAIMSDMDDDIRSLHEKDAVIKALSMVRKLSLEYDDFFDQDAWRYLNDLQFRIQLCHDEDVYRASMGWE